jgi:drug/metabolite transporter (DMT)-like permease
VPGLTPPARAAAVDRTAGAAPSRARLALGATAGVVAMLLYAGQFVISRWSLQRTLSLWDLATLRFGTAGLLLLPVVLRHGVRDAAGIGWGRAVALALTAGAPYTLILYAGLALAPASHGAVIIPAATPVVGTALVWLWFGERPWPLRLGGLAAIIAGLVLVSWPRAGGATPEQAWVGDLLFVAASVLWGLYTVLARRWHVDPLRGTAVVWVLALAYVPVYAILVPSRLAVAPAGEVLFQALYQGVGVAIMALLLYTRAIRALGASIASLLMPLIPIFGVLLAIPTLGEVPAPVQVAGMLAVSLGMTLAALPRRS